MYYIPSALRLFDFSTQAYVKSTGRVNWGNYLVSFCAVFMPVAVHSSMRCI